MKTKFKLKIHHVIFFGLFAILVYVRVNPPFAGPDWRKTYSKTDRIAFGNYVFDNLARDLFPGSKVSVSHNAIMDNEQTGLLSGYTNYVFITQSFAPDKPETEKLGEFVKAGGNVFISTRQIEGKLADYLSVRSKLIPIAKKDSHGVKLIHPVLDSEPYYYFNKGSGVDYLEDYDPAITYALGVNEEGHYNFVRIPFEEGNFYIHTVPEAFTNYFIAYGKYHEYAEKVLSHLPNENTLIDQNYLPYSTNIDSPTRYIMSEESLKWGWLVLLGGMLLYIFFEGKRKQRIIPRKESFQNTSLEFTEMIGQLYYQRGDHKNLADKKIRFLKEFMATELYLSELRIELDEVEKVTAKSGASEEDVRELFSLVMRIREMDKVPEKILHELNTKIESFYEQSKQ